MVHWVKQRPPKPHAKLAPQNPRMGRYVPATAAFLQEDGSGDSSRDWKVLPSQPQIAQQQKQ